MFLDLRLDKRIQSAANLGHCCFLSAILIAQGASPVLPFWANRLREQAKVFATGGEGQQNDRATGGLRYRSDTRQEDWPELTADWHGKARRPTLGLLPRCPVWCVREGGLRWKSY
jgi:hypothetical protein